MRAKIVWRLLLSWIAVARAFDAMRCKACPTCYSCRLAARIRSSKSAFNASALPACVALHKVLQHGHESVQQGARAIGLCDIAMPQRCAAPEPPNDDQCSGNSRSRCGCISLATACLHQHGSATGTASPAAPSDSGCQSLDAILPRQLRMGQQQRRADTSVRQPGREAHATSPHSQRAVSSVVSGSSSPQREHVFGREYVTRNATAANLMDYDVRQGVDSGPVCFKRGSNLVVREESDVMANLG